MSQETEDGLVFEEGRRIPFYMIECDMFDIYAPRVGASAWMVYNAICRHLNRRDQTTFRSQGTLCQDCRLSKMTVRKALGILEAVGLISIQSRTLKNGMRTSNVCRTRDVAILVPGRDDTKIALIEARVEQFESDWNHKSTEKKECVDDSPLLNSSKGVVLNSSTPDVLNSSKGVGQKLAGGMLNSSNRVGQNLATIQKESYPEGIYPEDTTIQTSPSEIRAGKPEIPATVPKPKKASVPVRTDPRITPTLQEIDRILPIGNWPRETAAIKQILALPCAPQPDEIIDAYRYWVSKRDVEKYGGTLYKFLDVVGGMVNNSRGGVRTDRAGMTMRQMYEKNLEIASMFCEGND